jgi:hypothetical protein
VLGHDFQSDFGDLIGIKGGGHYPRIENGNAGMRGRAQLAGVGTLL